MFVLHMLWCMSGSLTRNDRENLPDIPYAQPAILHICQEAHSATCMSANINGTTYLCSMVIRCGRAMPLQALKSLNMCSYNFQGVYRPWKVLEFQWIVKKKCLIFICPSNKVGGGYTGFTLSIRPFVDMVSRPQLKFALEFQFQISHSCCLWLWAEAYWCHFQNGCLGAILDFSVSGPSVWLWEV